MVSTIASQWEENEGKPERSLDDAIRAQEDIEIIEVAEGEEGPTIGFGIDNNEAANGKLPGT